MRVFEIPGYGGLEATDNAGVVSAYFRPRSEVLVYEDVEELARLIHEVLSMDAEELCRIARRAQERVVRQHTYRHRAAVAARALS
jgi:spore maturation protein CgeB